MKKLFLLLIVFFTIKAVLAQDIILKNDKTEIKVKVLEITPDGYIKYYNFDQLNGPIRNISSKDIIKITYQDGKTEIFKQEDKSNSNPGQLKLKNKSDQELKTIDYHEMNKARKKEIERKYSKGKRIVFNWGGKVGYFSPSMLDFVKFYGGGGLDFGLDFSIISRKGFGGGISIEYFGKRGVSANNGTAVNLADNYIMIIPITYHFLYAIKMNNNLNNKFYLGAGLGIYMSAEVANFNNQNRYYTVSQTDNTVTAVDAIGIHLLGGYHFKPVFIEAKVAIAPGISYDNRGLLGNNPNLGGFTIVAGLKF